MITKPIDERDSIGYNFVKLFTILMKGGALMATMRDVAQLAGVSTATVSHVHLGGSLLEYV